MLLLIRLCYVWKSGFLWNNCNIISFLYPSIWQILMFFTFPSGRNCPYDLKNFGLTQWLKLKANSSGLCQILIWSWKRPAICGLLRVEAVQGSNCPLISLHHFLSYLRVKNQRSAFRGESWTVLLCFSFVCFVLNSSLCTWSFSSCRITNTLLIPTSLYKWRKMHYWSEFLWQMLYRVLHPQVWPLCWAVRYPFFWAMPIQVESRLSGVGLLDKPPTKIWPQRLSVESAAHS